MEEKKWLGADLIFDLDADHIPGAQNLSYPEMLAKVKEEMIRLLDDFILGDLGFKEEDITVVFSGGRGYHAHVHDARLVSLKSHERREIVDFIAGTDLNFDWVFPERSYGKKEFNRTQRTGRLREIPRSGSGGWRGRMRLGVEWLLEEMRLLDANGVKRHFASAVSAQDRIVEGMLRDLYSKEGDKDGAQMMLENDNMACFTDVRHQHLFLQIIEKEIKPRFTGEIDEPVTSDIKRLIRLPGSLHGKTSFRVVPLDRQSLDSFDPFLDAVPEIYGDEEVEIFVKERTLLSLRGQSFDLEGWSRVPVYAALFLICRGKATFEAAE
jgi:DNA primase small subunit